MFAEETIEHFLFECPAFYKIRYDIFQNSFDSLIEIKKFAIKILFYVEKTKKISTNNPLFTPNIWIIMKNKPFGIVQRVFIGLSVWHGVPCRRSF